MATAADEVQDVKTDLEDAILYLLAGESDARDQRFKIPISDLHRLVAAVTDDLSSIGVVVKVHRTDDEKSVYSRQVEEALHNLVPYAIGVQNPSFSVVMNQKLAKVSLRRLEQNIPDEVRKKLDEIRDSRSFQQQFQQVSSPL